MKSYSNSVNTGIRIGDNDGIIYAIVADSINERNGGIGSAIVASIVSKHALLFFKLLSKNNSDDVGKAILKIQKMMLKRCIIEKVEYEDLATTLSLVLADNDKYVILSVGDSPIIINYKSKESEIMCGILKTPPLSITSYKAAVYEFKFECGDISDISRVAICSNILNKLLTPEMKVIDIINIAEYGGVPAAMIL